MVDFITPIVIVIILVALVAIVNAWVIGSADRSFFELMVKMPKFVDKSDARLQTMKHRHHHHLLLMHQAKSRE
jgi:uncharacterized membrane protein YqiK